MTENKLGLTEEERTVFYKDAEGKSLVGEIRHFDPVYGLLKLFDPMKNTVIEFLWDSDSSKWKGTGYQSGYIAEVRQFDPIYGFLKLFDPMKNTVIEFLWDSSSSKWKGTGVQSGYVAEVTTETPIKKQDASGVSAKATTVSRFPS